MVRVEDGLLEVARRSEESLLNGSDSVFEGVEGLNLLVSELGNNVDEVLDIFQGGGLVKTESNLVLIHLSGVNFVSPEMFL